MLGKSLMSQQPHTERWGFVPQTEEEDYTTGQNAELSRLDLDEFNSLRAESTHSASIRLMPMGEPGRMQHHSSSVTRHRSSRF